MKQKSGLQQLLINTEGEIILIKLISGVYSCSGAIYKFVEAAHLNKRKLWFSFYLEYCLTWKGNFFINDEEYGLEELRLLNDMEENPFNQNIKPIALVWEKIEWVIKNKIRQKKLPVTGCIMYCTC